MILFDLYTNLLVSKGNPCCLICKVLINAKGKINDLKIWGRWYPMQFAEVTFPFQFEPYFAQST